MFWTPLSFIHVHTLTSCVCGLSRSNIQLLNPFKKKTVAHAFYNHKWPIKFFFFYKYKWPIQLLILQKMLYSRTSILIRFQQEDRDTSVPCWGGKYVTGKQRSWDVKLCEKLQWLGDRGANLFLQSSLSSYPSSGE